ncbi:hypothetical protein GOP47_0014285 [Adiantum capillus-veneris]|uniref:SAP domain-containing protein n=1 Tax=Adiantum capillus-veneris TaxID=13818 RepID=A0A9D4ULZ8_ADICA|nr:hypothetical protein GOP47_0014285 [Adiantum capillus-veneris]
MASSPVAVSPTAQPEWRKMNKQALRDALASRGLDTNGLRPSLIQRLESSVKSLAAAEAVASSGADEPIEASQKESSSQIDLQSIEQTQTPNADSETIAPKISKMLDDKVTQEAMDAKASACKRDVVEVKSTAENGKSEHNSGNTAHLSDLEKKRLRAERFGVGLQVSEQEKLALRAERFAGVEGKKSSTVKEPESERRKQRAARFGIVEEESRKKTRQERFTPASKQEKSSEADKRKARAARFGAATEQTESKEK